MKDILKSSGDIFIEHNDLNETNETLMLSVQALPTAPPYAQPSPRITSSIASSDDSIKSNVYPAFDDAIGNTYKEMVETNDIKISAPDPKVGETCEVDLPNILTNDMICSCQIIGVIFELLDMILMRTFTQSDLDDTKSYEESLDRTECEL